MISKNTKKTIFIVLIILIALSFFYSRIAKNIAIDNGIKNKEEVEEVEEISEIEHNEQEEDMEQEPKSIELKKPPFIN
jgi:Na+-transporting methylmalonyl-CoA/oxaloacetate decarboxylase gamma subunit